MSKIFESDSKNYHAWSYRVWLIERFSLWEGELEYAESLLDKEVQNNSAWSYRYFLLNKCPNSQAGTLEHARAELTYLQVRRLPQDYSNEAAWVYLRGLYHLGEGVTQDRRVPIKELNLMPFL
jgi:protein farnesyltransferase/geranylgeranyltransferase type-1 subunit alpha